MVNLFNRQKSAVAGAPPAPRRPNFREYLDVTGELSSKELGHALWFVRHEVLIYRLLLIGLIIFSAVTWGWSGWRWIEYLAIGRLQDTALHQEIVRFPDYTAGHERFAPAPLAVLRTTLLPGGVNVTDAVAEVQNSNPKWLARFTYYFINGETRTPPQRATLLPGEARPLPAFAVPAVLLGGAVTVVLEDVRWERISPHLTADPVAWQTVRLDFSVSDFNVLLPGSAIEAPTAAAIQFKLTNQSPYHFAAPKFLIGLTQNQQLVALLPLELPTFRSLETKTVDLRSFVSNLQIDGLQVFPLVNPYDMVAYAPPTP